MAMSGAAGAPVVGSTSGDKSVAMTSSDTSYHIVRELNQPDDEIFCLRHMAQIARKRGNAYELMGQVLCTCSDRGIDLDAVLTPPPLSIDDPGASAHPFEILAVVNASAGYCQARTISPSGENSFFANAAFEMDVLSNDACNRAYQRNEAEVFSLFVHADDVSVVRALLAPTWKRAAGHSGQLISADCPSEVRVWLRQQRAYTACMLRAWLLIQRDSGRVSGALELLPRDETPLELPPPPPLPQPPPWSRVLPQPGVESAVAGAAENELLDELPLLADLPSLIAEFLDDT